jgi:hypothetical protein
MKPIIVKAVAAVALAGLLAGCTNPSGRPDYTANGALIGGASGAAIGALADRRAPGAGALIGGVAGLIAGGLIGHSMDQEAEARARSAPPPAYYPPPPGPPPSIGDIKAMTRSGLSDDVIIGQIINARAVYNLDANALIDLNNAGVSQKVIVYMVNTANTVVAQAPPPPQPESCWLLPAPIMYGLAASGFGMVERGSGLADAGRCRPIGMWSAWGRAGSMDLMAGTERAVIGGRRRGSSRIGRLSCRPCGGSPAQNDSQCA